MSHVDPVDIVANVATGGLYGAGKGIDQAITTGKVGSGLTEAANSLGPWGSVMEPISPQLAMAGNLVGAGAGIGGGLGSSSTSLPDVGGFNSPYYAGMKGPEGIPMLADPSTGFVAQHVAIDPLTGAAGPGAGIAADGIGALSGAGAATSGMGGTGALMGASAGKQIAGLLGGASPLAMPMTGGQAGSGGILTPQQRQALLSALQSEAHRGLAPKFEARMGGQQESPGIAALRGLAGGM